MALISCPDCGTQVSDAAAACPKCARPISHRMPAQAAPAPAFSPMTNQAQNVVVNVGNMGAPVPQWSPGVAAVLSFFIPGLGQLYKGQILNGIVWFFAVVFGYVMFIIPGLFLHLCCVIGAATGNPYPNAQGGSAKSSNAIVLVVLGVIVIGVISSQRLKEKAKKTDADPVAPTASAQAVEATPPGTISAAELVGAYLANESTADARFKGQVITVSGVVADTADSYITLVGSDSNWRTVQVFPDDDQKVEFAKCAKGQRITVRGRCKGLNGNVNVNEATIVR